MRGVGRWSSGVVGGVGRVAGCKGARGGMSGWVEWSRDGMSVGGLLLPGSTGGRGVPCRVGSNGVGMECRSSVFCYRDPQLGDGFLIENLLHRTSAALLSQ